ncbi:hypothetical protein [Ruegeria conchae]|uniref:hypothetical protein n=1 Tax=Ruegeria conchae TaxID=981384 RepID=UPI000237916B|nr:hypothetical protein [Ruegeria conchae]
MTRRCHRQARANVRRRHRHRLDSMPISIVVNKHAQRFYDQVENVWPKHCAIWGCLAAAQT